MQMWRVVWRRAGTENQGVVWGHTESVRVSAWVITSSQDMAFLLENAVTGMDGYLQVKTQ